MEGQRLPDPEKRDMVAGIITPDRNREQEAYYLTPAARDAGTGLLNKRAWTEYTIEQLNRKDGQVRWLVIIDIDDFKHINDTYGHIFGDQVIRRVAEIIAGIGGTAGRDRTIRRRRVCDPVGESGDQRTAEDTFEDHCEGICSGI